MANVNKGLLTEIQQIDSVNKKKREARGFSKNAVAGSVQILDSVAAKDEEAAEIIETKEAVEAEPEAQPEKQPTQQQSVITPELLKEFLQTAVTNAITPLQQSLEATQAKASELESKLNTATQELDATKEELATKSKDAATLNDLAKIMGKPVEVPMVNLRTNSKSDKPEGCFKEFLDFSNSLPTAVKTNARGHRFAIKDTRAIDAYVREHKKELIKDLEAYGKANGLMSGSGVRVTDAYTANDGSIPGAFLDTLSAIMRTNNRPGFVFWQFADTKIDWAKGEGDSIQIPRAAFQPAPLDPNDRLLSGDGTYYRIDPTSQNITTGVVRCTIQEYGLGKNSQYPPVGIPAFVQAYSMLDLMAILERNIAYDYNLWEDLKIRSLFAPTSRVVYNNKGSVITSTGALAASSNGTMAYTFLNNLYAYMRSLLIPTYMDGRYCIVMPSQVVASLKNDLGTRYQFVTTSDLQALTEILNPTVIGSGEVDKISGYVGNYSGFMIFESNAFGVGAAGTEGVQNETINSVSTLTRTAYAFGANTIGRGIGTEMEIRNDPQTDFGRSQRFIWRSEENAVPIDVDPVGYSDVSATPQQLRVIAVHTLDTAI